MPESGVVGVSEYREALVIPVDPAAELSCILCESGYHDHVWEVSHVVQCGCPCHG